MKYKHLIFLFLFILISFERTSCSAINQQVNTTALANDSTCAFFNTLASAEAATLPSSTQMIGIISYAILGDSPPRWMMRLMTAPNPIQPWHVKMADGSYWQDVGGDFYPEFLGATIHNPDCSSALQNAFRAHMYLKMRLRGMGNRYICTNQVHFDTIGFADGGCDVDFNGIGNSRISFANGVSSPCFLLAASAPQNDFWGRFVNLEIDANVEGIAAQFGRSDLTDPSNDFEISVNVKNNSTSDCAQALVMNAFYSSPFNICGNCGGIDTGLTAVQLNRCNMCRGFIAAGNGNQGLVLSNYTNGNDFSVDLEVLTTGLIQSDTTCGFNEISCGAISNLTYAIDNHLGGPLSIGNLPIGGDTYLFTNPTANDATWGGCGVTFDMNGQYLTGFVSGPMPAPNVWIMNKSCQPQWVSIFGSSQSDPFQVNIRLWYDFSDAGWLVADVSPCGFILQPGEKVSISYPKNSKKYTWSWRPLL